MEPYLNVNNTRELKQCLTTLQLCSHKLLVERGRWLKAKLDYNARLRTLCESRDIEDDYHIRLICTQYSDLRR